MIIVLAVIAITINCMTLAAIRYIRRRLSANQTMMFSLCCADLLTSIGIMAKVINDHVLDMHFVPREQKYSATCAHKIIQVCTWNAAKFYDSFMTQTLPIITQVHLHVNTVIIHILNLGAGRRGSCRQTPAISTRCNITYM